MKCPQGLQRVNAAASTCCEGMPVPTPGADNRHNHEGCKPSAKENTLPKPTARNPAVGMSSHRTEARPGRDTCTKPGTSMAHGHMDAAQTVLARTASWQNNISS